MLDSWITKIHMSLQHLDRSYLVEGEQAGLWDREISQMAENFHQEERETLHQVMSIARVITRYLKIFNGRNDLMMADNELINHQIRVDQGMGLSKERWQLPEMAGAMNIKLPPISKIQTPGIVPHPDASYEELISA